MDIFANIAAGGISNNKKGLVSPGRIKKGDKKTILSSSFCREELNIPLKEDIKTQISKLKQHYQPFLAECAPVLEQHRQKQVLEEFEYRLLPFEETTKVKLPHYGGPLGNRTAIYTTTFTKPVFSENQSCFIIFKGVDYIAQVFINDIFAGSHEGFFAPFEFDITPYLKNGANTLKVVVKNDFIFLGSKDDKYNFCEGDKLYAATGLGYDDWEFGWHHCPPGMGIYDEVALEVRENVHIHDVFATSDGEIITINADIYNSTYEKQDITLLISVFGSNFKQEIIKDLEYTPFTKKIIADTDSFSQVMSEIDGTKDKMLPLPLENGVNSYKIETTIKDYKMWTCDTPYLYQVQIKLVAFSKVVDTFAQNFGIRTFTQDVTSTKKGMYYLNGTPIRLRGANTMGFEQQAVLKGDFNQLIEDILLAKVCNMNFWRITQRPVQKEIYEYCDKLGFLVQTDLPLFGVMRRTKVPEALRQVEEMAKHVRSYACNTVISYINEPFPNANNKPHRHLNRKELEMFFDAADIIVRLQNEKQVIKHVDGDYDPPSKSMPDNHCYPLWYNEHGIEIGKLYQGRWMPVKENWYYGCGEYGAEGLEDLATMEKYYPKKWLKKNADGSWNPSNIVMAQTQDFHYFFYDTQNTIEEWIEESQKHQAFATKIITEAYRRNDDMVSFAIHLFIDAFPSGWMKTIVDCDRNPKKAFFEYQKALRPLLITLRADKWAYFDDENIEIECYISNDSLDVYENSYIIYELYAGNQFVQGAKHKAETIPNGTKSNACAYIRAIKAESRVEYTLKAYLVGNNKILSDNTFSYTVFPSSQRIVDFEHCHITHLSNVLLQRAREGAVIFVELEKGNFSTPAGEIVVKKCCMLPVNFVSRNKIHSSLANYKSKDFKFWYSKKTDCITPIASNTYTCKGVTELLTSAGLDEHGKMQKETVLGEYKIGNGKLLFSTISLQLLMENPAGNTLLGRLV